MIAKQGKILKLVVLIVALITTFTVTYLLKNIKSEPSSNNNQTSEIIEATIEDKNKEIADVSVPKKNEELLAKINSSMKVEITHYFHNYFEANYKPAVITDKYIISLIKNLITTEIEPSTKSMSGMSARDGQKIVFYDADNNQTVIPFSYDSLYNFGYIEYNGGKIFLPYDFFRLIANAETVRPVKADIPEDVSGLFKKYNWTPAFLVSSEKKTIPADLLISSEELPDKLYWAYNMELSKGTGMDFSKLLSKEVTAEIYSLVEPLPEFAKPQLNARGIIIRCEGRIAGAYIDSGVSSASSCTLSGKSFKELTGSSISQWLNTNYIDKKNSLYRRISGMSHEELIRAYFKAMTDRDTKMLFATMTTDQCLNSLFTNMQNGKLYNMPQLGWNMPGYIDKIEIKEIKKYSMQKADRDKICYAVTADITPTSNAVITKGINTRFVILEKDGGVWKIAGDGTGP